MEFTSERSGEPLSRIPSVGMDVFHYKFETVPTIFSIIDILRR